MWGLEWRNANTHKQQFFRKLETIKKSDGKSKWLSDLNLIKEDFIKKILNGGSWLSNQTFYNIDIKLSNICTIGHVVDNLLGGMQNNKRALENQTSNKKDNISLATGVVTSVLRIL